MDIGADVVKVFIKRRVMATLHTILMLKRDEMGLNASVHNNGLRDMYQPCRPTAVK